jgi:4-aminobutyrate aminotransferase
MIGVEIQGDDARPDPAMRDRVVMEAFERGLLLLPCGPSTIRFSPPLCLSSRQVQTGLRLFGEAMESATLAESIRAVITLPSPRV